MFKNLVVTDGRQNRSSNAQHIAEILPLVLAELASQETQLILGAGYGSAYIMPLHCVSAGATGSPLSWRRRAIFIAMLAGIALSVTNLR